MPDTPFTFFDRDISWLHFNGRLLDEAANTNVPLKERIRFLSIFSSNLDEFYRVRIPVIKAVDKITKKNKNANYKEVEQLINQQQNKFGEILQEDIVPQLAALNYILVQDEQDLPETLAPTLKTYFYTEVAGLLQIIELLPNSDFFPENNHLYVNVVLDDLAHKTRHYYLITVPSHQTPRFLSINEGIKNYVIFLEDIIAANLAFIFPEMHLVGIYNIKITRDAELDLKDDFEEDLAEKIEKQLIKRDFGFATRLLYPPNMPLDALNYLVDIFKLEKAVLIQGGKYHNLKDLEDFPLPLAMTANTPWPAIKKCIPEEQTSLLDSIILKDQLVHPPYQSYDTILRFFNEAAIDSNVEEIYVTFYRIAANSKIANALITAAKNKKNVTVLVELKARFDEANNISWAKKMKANGVKIIYTQNNIKVHAKVALIKRKHPTHPLLGMLATGNMNESTARFYTDHILLTAYQPMLSELKNLFNFLNLKKKEEPVYDLKFEHLLVAKFNLQEEFLALIEQEIQHAKAGLPCGITIKLNNLEEEVMIAKLYEASNAGVKIELMVRGICRLIPGIPNQSENIQIKRIIDRYLEHGRIFIFNNNNQPKVFMGSADWMNRNIYRRIEVCFPVYDEMLKSEVKDLIQLQLQDNIQAVWIDALQQNSYVKNDDHPLQSQLAIYDYLKQINNL